MPDTLNKQAIVNLLIDSPLREPIKINLIDIVNNTNEPDLPKVYGTIVKELEIFQKATERRMKLADETIAKLGGSTPVTPTVPQSTTNDLPPAQPTLPTPPLSVPPLDLPPLPTSSTAPRPTETTEPTPPPPSTAQTPPPLQPLGAPTPNSSSDEDALAEIQKELDSLKSTTAAEVATAATPTSAPTPAPQA
jgi:hypothetical protein